MVQEEEGKDEAEEEENGRDGCEEDSYGSELLMHSDFSILNAVKIFNQTKKGT